MSEGRYSWDLDTPHPNVEIDTLRVVTKQALEDLRGAVDAVQAAQNGVDDTYWLSDLLFSLVDTALADLDASAQERQQLRDDVAELTARLDALQSPDSGPDQEIP